MGRLKVEAQVVPVLFLKQMRSRIPPQTKARPGAAAASAARLSGARAVVREARGQAELSHLVGLPQSRPGPPRPQSCEAGRRTGRMSRRQWRRPERAASPRRCAWVGHRVPSPTTRSPWLSAHPPRARRDASPALIHGRRSGRASDYHSGWPSYGLTSRIACSCGTACCASASKHSVKTSANSCTSFSKQRKEPRSRPGFVKCTSSTTCPATEPSLQ